MSTPLDTSVNRLKRSTAHVRPHPVRHPVHRPTPTRRALLVGGAASVAAFALVPSALAAGRRPHPAAASGADNSLLHRWAADTWHSLDAMTVAVHRPAR